MGEKIELTQEELDAKIAEGIKVGVQEAKLEILIGDFQSHKNEEETRWAEMFALVRAFPEKVTACKDTLETDFYKELEDHYVTKADIKLLKQEIKSQNKEISNKFKWTVGVIAAVAGVLQFAATMIYLSYQIARLSGVT